MVPLALGFGLSLGLSTRGPIFRAWLFFVGAAVLSSYVVEVLDGYGPWHMSAEWAFPETWLMVAAIGIVAWLCQRILLGSPGHSRAAP